MKITIIIGLVFFVSIITYCTGEKTDYRLIYRGYSASAPGTVNLFHEYGFQYKVKYWFGSVWHNVKSDHGDYYVFSLAVARWELIEMFHLDDLSEMLEIVLYDPHPKWRKKKSFYDKDRPNMRVISP